VEHDLERLLAEALKLSAADRAALADALAESLEESDQAAVDVAWAAEIARRVRDYKAGRTKPIPWGEARRILRGE
jgi:putative addiction module component (TIGR02574 family)